MVEIILAVLAGVNLSFAVLSGIIYIRSKKYRLYLYFGIFSFFSGLYFLLGAIDTFVSPDLTLPTLVSAAIYYSVFPWFISSIIDKKGRFNVVFPIIFSLAIIVLLLSGETSEPAQWQIIAHFGLLGLVTLLISGINYVIKVNRSEKVEFVIISLLFIILAIEEMSSQYLGWPMLARFTGGVLPLDLYPIFFSIIMGYRVTQDIIEKIKLRLINAQMAVEVEQLKVKEMEKDQLAMKLEYKQKDLTDLSLELGRRKEFSKLVHDKLKILKFRLNNGEATELNDIINFTKVNAGADAGIEAMISDIDKVNHAFFAKIRSTYPDLTDNELNLASLLRLNLGTKEIASLKGISPNSVKVLQYRLRKKLGLDSKVSLRQFFAEIE